MTPALLDDHRLRAAQAAAPTSGGVHTTTTDPAEDAPACAVCPHPLSGHDAIALRFCRATVDAELDRGCACRSA